MPTGNEFLDRLAKFAAVGNGGLGIRGLDDRLNMDRLTPYSKLRLSQEMLKRISADPSGEIRLRNRSAYTPREATLLAGAPPVPEQE